MTSDEDEFIIGQRGEKVRILDLDKKEEEKRKKKGKEGEELRMRTLLEFENAVLDLFEDNRITLEGAKTVLWTLTAIYEDELIEEPHRRETLIENIERQKEQLLINILGVK
ncbi:MAG: hypothetical protein WCC17_22535 [Candidatus Nitrosopolaris sp.]